MKTSALLRSPVLWAGLLFALAALLLRLPAGASADYAPFMNIRINPNFVQAFGWPLGDTLTLTIDDPATPASPDFSTSGVVAGYAPSNPSLTLLELSPGQAFHLAAGQLVTISNGPLTKSLTVMDLYVTSFDPAAKTISGHSAAFADLIVNIWPDYSSTFYQRNVTADQNGLWQALFDTYPGALPPTTHGAVNYWDLNGSGDAVSYYINQGSIYAWTDTNTILLQNCFQYQSYTLTIDHPANGTGVDYSITRVPEPGVNFVSGVVIFRLNGFTLLPGDLVTITAGHDVRTLVAQPRGSFSFDITNDIIGGKNRPNALLNIVTPGGLRSVQADAAGDWSIDYKVPDTNSPAPAEDIVIGMRVGIHESDPDGDFSSYPWTVPDPKINVHLTENRVETNGWPVGVPLALKISGGGGPDYTANLTTIRDALGRFGYANFLLDPAFRLVPGQTVTVKSADLTKTMTPMDLYVTAFDSRAKTITGRGPVGARVVVGIWVGSGDHLEVLVDSSGVWQADFSDFATQYMPYNDGIAWSLDGNGNTTSFHYNLWKINAYPESNRIKLQNCLPGRMYAVSVTDPASGTNWNYPEVTCGADARVYLQFSDFQLDAGDRITVSYVREVKQMVVTPRGSLHFEIIDDLISGVDQPNLYTVVNLPGSARFVQAGPLGNWSVDYKISWNNPISPPMDILPGLSGSIADPDVDGDFTSYAFTIPAPASGKVTGGGWIFLPVDPAVPPEPNPADRRLPEKAAFSFEVFYEKTTGALAGETEFTFKDFHFVSTALKWLVIEGKRMQLCGSGQVNGAGTYGFLLSATAGTRGDGAYRLRIWDTSGALVFDNMPSTPDYQPPDALLRGGTIRLTP